MILNVTRTREMVGTCILNCMTNCIKERINSVKIFVLLEQDKSMIGLTPIETVENVTEEDGTEVPPGCPASDLSFYSTLCLYKIPYSCRARYQAIFFAFKSPLLYILGATIRS